MNNWNSLLRESIGTPEVPGGRGRKKSTRVPLTDAQIKQKTIEWAGRQTQSHSLYRKATAPGRVLEKAMQYHTAEANRRKARRVRKADKRGWMVTIVFIVTMCSVFMCVLPEIFR